MRKLGQSDRDFLRRLCGDGKEVREVRLRMVMRKGHLLLLLPTNAQEALNTLSLYQPQTRIAKAYVICLRQLLKFRLQFLLPSLDVVLRENSVFHSIVNEGVVGLLLGNPHADARRAIIYHTQGQEKFVTKLGSGGKARMTVANECHVLKECAKKLSAVPTIIDSREEADSAYYTVEWVKGKAPVEKDQPRLLKLLESWHSGNLMISLRELPIWGALLESCKASKWHGVLEGVDHIEVVTTAVHGDFAPWNIKVLRGGEILVLDWELCREGGAAGWDWVHYLVQTYLLVKKLSPVEVLEAVEIWAASKDGESFFTKNGWNGHVHELIGTYLIYAHYLLGMDRKELLECWEKRG